jgi:hypothetical protein
MGMLDADNTVAIKEEKEKICSIKFNFYLHKLWFLFTSHYPFRKSRKILS